MGVSWLPRAGSVFVNDFDVITKRNHVVEQSVSVNGEPAVPDADQHAGWTGVLNQIHDVVKRFFNGFQLPFSEDIPSAKNAQPGRGPGSTPTMS